MKKALLSVVILVAFVSGRAQNIHSPADLFKIMEKSKISYQLNSLKKPVECPDYSEKLNYHDSYRVITDSTIKTFKFKTDEITKSYFDKAEEFFQKTELDSALRYYKLAVTSDSSLTNVMTYIGQIYEKKNDFETAISWYKRAIKKNYIDYMAHWFLADNYVKTKEIKKAVDEIVIARIFNRNNPRIKKAYDRILSMAKRKTVDWYFNPQVKLDQITEEEVSITLKDTWTGYAIAKALWTYEPGYRESMGVAQGQYSLLEDKECLFALYATLDKKKKEVKNDPQLKILIDAAENKHLQEYILYELVLPEYPHVAYQLPEAEILSIKDYILKYRDPK